MFELKTKLTPISVLTLSALIGIAATVIYILIATQRPWFGFTFIPEETSGIKIVKAEGPSAHVPVNKVVVGIESQNGKIDLLPIDLTIEPDGKLHTYEIYENFLERQGNISEILNSRSVTFISNTNEKFTVSPNNSRPLSTLPGEFWVQMIVGLFAWLISSAVFAFRQKEASAQYLLLSGAATLVFAPFAAIYTTRELAMPEALFMWLSDGNFFGGSIFMASFVALLLCYPRPIGPKWIGPSLLALYLIWFVLQQMGVFSSMTFARRFLVMAGILSTFILAGIHWFRTRKDPIARASLQWFLLSWMLGTCVFAFFILIPQIFGIDTSQMQGYAFSLFLLVYAGLAFGILRYKLFALGQWWGNIVLWALTALMLVVFDLLFLLALQFSSGLSISLALLLSGILWIPLRSFVWNRFLYHHTLSREDQFKQVVDIALTPPGQDINTRWQQLLKNIFDPLYLHETRDITHCILKNDGQILLITRIGNIPSLCLVYAYRGHRLFTSHDVKLAEELVALLSHIIDSRSAYEKGVSEERQRIARDMHDNIGAQLLGALHNPNTERKDTLIRETLSDLRDIINDTSRTGLTFEEMLADLRMETTERLFAAGITLNWVIPSNSVPHLEVPVMNTLRSIVREAVSNILKHSHASFVCINIQYSEGAIHLSIEDNGKGIDMNQIERGNGLANMESRIAGVNGELKYIKIQNGLHLTARFPIEGARVV